jgi:hypothetical protein
MKSGDGRQTTIYYDRHNLSSDFEPVFESLDGYQVQFSTSTLAGNSFFALRDRVSKYDALFMHTGGRIFYNVILCNVEEFVQGPFFRNSIASTVGKVAMKALSVLVAALGVLSCAVGAFSIAILGTAFPHLGTALAVALAVSLVFRSTQVFVGNQTVQKIMCIADLFLSLVVSVTPVTLISAGVGLMMSGRHLWNPEHSPVRLLETAPYGVDMRMSS